MGRLPSADEDLDLRFDFFVELPRSAALAPERAEHPPESAVPDLETVGASERNA